MKFTTNDLTYPWDMSVLHNNIDGIHNQIQKNITVFINTLNDFPAVDEVNTPFRLVKCFSSHGISSLSSRVLNKLVLGLRRNSALTVL